MSRAWPYRIGFEQFRRKSAQNERMSKSVASSRIHIVEVSAVLFAAVLALAPLSPRWVETWYSTAVYPRIEQVLTPVSNQVPFALLDLLLVVLLLAVLVTLVPA